MKTIPIILVTVNWVLPLAYLALLIDYGATFILRTRARGPIRWLACVAVAHGVYLALVGAEYGWQVVDGAYMVPSVLALLMAVVYLIIEVATNDRRTGAFVLCFAFLAQYTSSMFFQRVGAALAEGGGAAVSQWQQAHVIPAALAYTSLALAGVYGLLHVLAGRSLKRRSVGIFFDRLPPLDTLARMTWWALVAGFVFLTVTIVVTPLLLAGGAGAAGGQGLEAKILVKIGVGVLAWAVYAAAVIGKLVGKWSPQRVSVVAIVGLLVVVVLLVASALLTRGSV